MNLRHLRLPIGIVISAFFLWLVVRQVNFDEAMRSLRQVNWLLMIPAIAVFLASYVLRAFRWQVLLDPVGRVSLSSSFRAIMIGFMGNSIFPARMGEFLRAFTLVRRERLRFESVFATIVIERLFDGYMLLLFLFGALLMAPLHGTGGSLLRTGIIGALFIYTAALIGILFLHHRREATLTFFRKALRWMPGHQRVLVSLEKFASGLAIFDSLRQLAAVAVWTLVVWVVSMAVVHPVIWAFPLGVSLPWYAPYVITPIVALGVLIPSAPGYAGPYHAACVAAVLLMAPEVDRDANVAFAFVLHAMNMIPIIVVGVVCVWLEGLSLGDLSKKAVSSSDEGG
ncbi:flippase-like domain-containing protein [Candidatus Fermentibacteria bacterium]|nr:flippase-like domain-containing protein [Candidatus Fermentibacteria bacterium]